MTPQPTSREAEALDALLDYQPFSSSDLDAQDARLAQAIRALVDGDLPVNRNFYHALDQKLQNTATRRGRRPFWGIDFSLASILGAATLLALILLIILGSFFIPSLIGQPKPAATLVTKSPTVVPLQTLLHTPTPVPTTSAVPTTPTIPVDGSNGLLLKTMLPDTPTSAPVYYQGAAGEVLTVESAQSMAARLGVEGPVFQYPGETGQTVYTVSNGPVSVLFYGSDTLSFTYMANYAPADGEGKAPLPFDQQAQIATQWLASRGLLNFPYRVEPCATADCVMFVQKLEGGTVYQKNPYDPHIYAQISPAGQVGQIIYRPMQLIADGSQAILSAQEAWNIIKTRRLDPRVFFQTLSFPNRRGLKTWNRAYQPGQIIYLYGYAAVLQPVEAGQPVHVEVNDMYLGGNDAMAARIPTNTFLAAWGIYQVDGQGLERVDLQGWGAQETPEEHVTGVIASNNGALQLKSDAGAWYTLPDLPPDIIEGEKLSTSGVVGFDNRFEWRYLQTQMTPDENQQIGTLPYPGMPVEMSGAPTPALPDTGYRNGDPVSIQGILKSTLKKYPDGYETLVNTITIGGADGVSAGWPAELTGDGAKGIERYHNLPVKVEGIYAVDTGGASITVTRYEPVWPDVQIQAYFGAVSETSIEGKTVLVLTEDSGQQWVIGGFMDGLANLAQMGWKTGAQIAVEGYPEQQEPKQLGGLPVLHDFGTSLLGVKGSTRETYRPYASQPEVENVEQPVRELPAGVVEQVELVYAGQTQRGGLPSGQLPRLVLPFWRFTGHLDDGRPFEILVLASQTAGIP